MKNSIIEEMKEFGLDTNEAFNILVKAIFRSTMFRGAEYDGTMYNELPNIWGSASEKGVEKKYCCNSDHSFAEYYENAECAMDVIDRVEADFSDIQFCWDWEGVDCEIDEYELENEEAILEYLESLPDKEDQVVIDSIVTMRNDMGANSDHRGSDHCLLVLPFTTRTQMKSPTLREFISHLYLLKSHKFDGWYEMYCRLSAKELEYTCELDLSFDHGS
ncbi:hypothetical protein [Candidatus Uabimicrobium amorphum]|uniref:Uncharacterized protein n=1 Tax=Uabimicrobium amorphum TaxID=2596890 RepID=A0A5S9ILY2_UABAM|nr:hypothetical protein [Candidatus Uabimicrobium amorphum]BBM83866.1 hypothetical protein UABAM_02221 [Candidatus Uabimicrobium amorphum]